MALGGALFGASRGSAKGRQGIGGQAGREAASGRGPPAKPGADDGGRKPEPRSRPNVRRSAVRTKPNAPEVTAPTQYWPPPAPKPPRRLRRRRPAARDGGAARPGQVDPGAVKRGYERLDAKPGTIVKVMLSSAVVIVGCIAGLFYLVGRQHGEDRQGPPLTQQQLAVIVPPGPHLQDHPLHDIAMENKREFDLLKYYAWTDADHRAGRIPIARAQALVVGRPLDPLPTPGAAAGRRPRRRADVAGAEPMTAGDTP